MKEGLNHAGIILSRQLPIGAMLKALLRLLSDMRHERVRNEILPLLRLFLLTIQINNTNDLTTLNDQNRPDRLYSSIDQRN